MTGAIPKSALEIAQNAEDNNIVVLETAKEHLLLLGVDPNHPTGIVEVFAPVSGTITDQQMTNHRASRGYRLRIRSPFPTCRTSGSSATCMRTTWRRCISASMRTFIWWPIRTAF